MCLDHSSQEHIPFIDQVTMRQMKDAALTVLSREIIFCFGTIIYNRYFGKVV